MHHRSIAKHTAETPPGRHAHGIRCEGCVCVQLCGLHSASVQRKLRAVSRVEVSGPGSGVQGPGSWVLGLRGSSAIVLGSRV
eukprot:3581013-Rhodomonas_salina.1